MIKSKSIGSLEEFENLKKGDIVACEFHLNVHDYPKTYRFKVFTIAENKKDYQEIILQKKKQYLF